VQVIITLREEEDKMEQKLGRKEKQKAVIQNFDNG